MSKAINITEAVRSSAENTMLKRGCTNRELVRECLSIAEDYEPESAREYLLYATGFYRAKEWGENTKQQKEEKEKIEPKLKKVIPSTEFEQIRVGSFVIKKKKKCSSR